MVMMVKPTSGITAYARFGRYEKSERSTGQVKDVQSSELSGWLGNSGVLDGYDIIVDVMVVCVRGERCM